MNKSTGRVSSAKKEEALRPLQRERNERRERTRGASSRQ